MWNTLLFLVPELQHSDVHEKTLACIFLCCQRLPNQSPLMRSAGNACLFKTDQCRWVHTEWHADSINGRLRRSAGPSPGSSEHRCSGVSTFAGAADHATYFNSMWWATFCTKPVKLQHRIGDAPVKCWTKSMAVCIIITLQSRYSRDDHDIAVVC